MDKIGARVETTMGRAPGGDDLPLANCRSCTGYHFRLPIRLFPQDIRARIIIPKVHIGKMGQDGRDPTPQPTYHSSHSASVRRVVRFGVVIFPNSPNDCLGPHQCFMGEVLEFVLL